MDEDKIVEALDNITTKLEGIRQVLVVFVGITIIFILFSILVGILAGA